MPKRTRSYESDLLERLRDPGYAAEYLKAALQDDEEQSEAVFLLALRDVAKANRIAYVADATGLNRESLYKMLSETGNPSLSSLKSILNALGMKLSVETANADVGVRETTFDTQIPISSGVALKMGSVALAGLGSVQKSPIQHIGSIGRYSVSGSTQPCLNLIPVEQTRSETVEFPPQPRRRADESQFAYVA